MGRRSMALAVGSALVAASVVGATANAAEPDPLTTLQAAVEASEKAAANGFDGTLDVRVGQKSNATDLLGDAGLWAVVPAGGLIRLHVTAAADGRWYESVRRLPGGEYLGGWGIAGPDNGWMSPAAMASSQWQADNYLAFGASRVGRTGAITGLRPRTHQDPVQASG